MSRIGLTPVQQKKYKSIKNKTIAERYKDYCLATARIKRQEEEAKRKASESLKQSNNKAWEEKIKSFILIPKPCSELQIGDVFKGSVDPYFCEVVDILPNNALPDYRLIQIKLLPSNVIGEGTYLLLTRTSSVVS